jgi:hypothetical protein
MQILDLYDDPSALVLCRHLEKQAVALPEKLAALSPRDPEQLTHLPDRLFALVGTCDGEPLRKYAMHDPEHLATSILYFLECGAALPDATRAKVAMNLITACGWYETAPPLALTKVAYLGAIVNTGLALSSAPAKLRSEKMKNLQSDQAMRAAQASGIKEAQRGRSASSPDEAWSILDKFIRGEESPADQYGEFGETGYANLFKEANLIGTELGVQGGLSSDPRPNTPQKRFATAPKVSGDDVVSTGMATYDDLCNWQAAGDFSLLAPAAKVATAQHYALPTRQLYPIDTVDQVKRASAYFDEYHRAFDTDDRRLFAQSVAMRAEDLGIKVSGALTKIAGNAYGPHIIPELKGRIAALEGTGKEASYEVLLEQIDATPPIVMYDMLKIADEDSGMDQSYGRPVTGFKDPLSAVFGAPEKPIYSWVGKGHYVTEEQLRSYSKLVPEQLDKVLGDGWCAKFAADPVKEFDKLPDAQKIVVSRLANGEAFRFI